MRHEKIIKREDGKRIKITIRLFIDWNYSGYRVDAVGSCKKGKRKFESVFDEDDYKFRELNMDDRQKYKMDRFLECVTREEIDLAKSETWEKVSPRNLKSNF